MAAAGLTSLLGRWTEPSLDHQERMMPFWTTETSVRTLDGLHLVGALVEPELAF